jgi:hypothetical protein
MIDDRLGNQAYVNALKKKMPKRHKCGSFRGENWTAGLDAAIWSPTPVGDLLNSYEGLLNF